MKPFLFAAAVILAGVPAAFAAGQDVAPSSNVMVTPPVNSSPNVDPQTATADQARQDFYQDKLDAAKAQAKADSAIADRDAAQARAADDRAVQRNSQYPQ